MTRLKTVTLSLVAIMGLTACETVEGAGRDISSAGEAISEAAEE
ncbi:MULTISPECIES: entericidin A/B family lipoprotein [unclassified Roseovarius]|nr:MULTISPECIES: entericidin A/B family lipoprotein [unclassified Roseovarius]